MCRDEQIFGHYRAARITLVQVENLKQVLAWLRRDVLPLNEGRYRVMAEPVESAIDDMVQVLRRAEELVARDCVTALGVLLAEWGSMVMAASKGGVRPSLGADVDKMRETMSTVYTLMRCMAGAGFEVTINPLPLTGVKFSVRFTEMSPGKRFGWHDDELAEVAIYEAARQALGPVREGS